MTKQLKAAWTGFRLPDTAPWKMYELYANMGYKGLDGEISNLPGDPVENLKRFKDLGLSCLCTSIGGKNGEVAKDRDKIGEIVKKAEFYDVKKVNIGYTSVIDSFGSFYGNNGTYDSMMRDIEDLNAITVALADEGLEPMYHNHYQEFLVTYDGVPVIDYYLTQIDKRLKIKLDVGWVYVGGVDPVEYMGKLGDRIALLHIKDFTEMIQPRYLINADKETDFGFTAVGTGKLDLKGIFGKALEIGQEWAIVEQDRERILPWKDAIACAYYNMKETGLVE